MSASQPDIPVLRQFRASLDAIYGDRVKRVLLLGSRARGDERHDSDYDIAVFLSSLPDPWHERMRLANLELDYLDATGAFFEAKPFAIGAYDDQTPLMHEIRRDGLDL